MAHTDNFSLSLPIFFILVGHFFVTVLNPASKTPLSAAKNIHAILLPENCSLFLSWCTAI